MSSNGPAPQTTDATPTLAVSRGDVPQGDPADKATPSQGDVIGRYVVLETLGSGGMGAVFRAYDPKLQREVALKQLHREDLLDDGQARLVTEARAMAQLSHPNVVAVYDVDVVDGGVMLAMELVPGDTLRQWLRGRRGWREVMRVMRQAGEGLAAAHAAGLVHRDFKPSNVLLSGNQSGEPSSQT